MSEHKELSTGDPSKQGDGMSQPTVLKDKPRRRTSLWYLIV